MLRIVFFSSLLLCLLTPVFSQDAMDNAAVLTMVKAGFSDDVIVARIMATPCDFDLGADRLAELKQAGVSERTILLMIRRMEAQRKTPAPAMQQSPQRPMYDMTKGREGTTPPEPATGPYVDEWEPPRGEVFGGFSYRRFKDTNTLGWNAALGGYLNEWFGVVGGFCGTYESEQVLGSTVRFEFYSVMAGPRFTGRRGRCKFFTHVLAGATNGSARYFFETIEDTWVFSYGFGGGLDVGVNRNLAIRVLQADGIYTRYEGETGSSARVSFGIVGRF